MLSSAARVLRAPRSSKLDAAARDALMLAADAIYRHGDIDIAISNRHDFRAASASNAEQRLTRRWYSPAITHSATAAAASKAQQRRFALLKFPYVDC